jgi:hypothetical protein
MDIFCGWDIVVFRLDILSAGIYHLDLIICESNFFIFLIQKEMERAFYLFCYRSSVQREEREGRNSLYFF